MMDLSNPTIVDVARLIAERKVADDYQFFVILTALGILAALVLWFVAPYLGERGKLLAMAEKLEDRLNDIRQTTEAAEDVRTRIAHGDWTTKEYKTLLRNKLEQLMGAAYRVKAASEVDAKFREGKLDLHLTSREPIIEIQLLSPLYFSVMHVQLKNFIDAHTRFAVWLIGARSKQKLQSLEAKHERSKLDRIRAETSGVLEGVTLAEQFEIYKRAHAAQIAGKETYVEEHGPLSRGVAEALTALEARAALLMKDLIAPVE